MFGSAGCDDRPSARSARTTASNATTQPPTGPADPAQTAGADQPSTVPTATQPANAFLTVDGAITTFPPARLRLTRTDEGVRALLFSDDPREAISADYRGNSFYFDIPLKVPEPKDVTDAEYYFKAPDSDAEQDSPNGIFLNGMRTHLQPQDMVLTFRGEWPKVVASIGGRFLVVDTANDSTPGQFAGVAGNLMTTAEVKEE